MSLGLALGGGGAKGLVHIGILDVLEKHNIIPRYIAGTSIGAIVGALYCLEGSAKGLREKATAMIQSDEFNDFGLSEFYIEDENTFERFKKEVFEKFYFGRLLFRRSHIKKDAARKLFSNLFKKHTFSDCKIRFACNALNIQTGEEVVFTSGLLCNAVWASCAIPGILPPYINNDKILVDGGVVDNIPVEPVMQLGARVIIASYLGHRPSFRGVPDTGFRISQRAQSFVRYHLDQKILKLADYTIKPDVDPYHWADFSQIERLVRVGTETAERNIQEIKKVTSFWYRARKILMAAR